MQRIVVIAIVLTVAASVAVVVRNWERNRRVEIKLILEPIQWIEPITVDEKVQAI